MATDASEVGSNPAKAPMSVAFSYYVLPSIAHHVSKRFTMSELILRARVHCRLFLGTVTLARVILKLTEFFLVTYTALTVLWL
jgi:hypothetical protein